jgi:hypothetical protein
MSTAEQQVARVVSVRTAPASQFVRSVIAFALARSGGTGEAATIADERWPHDGIGQALRRAAADPATLDLVPPGSSEFLSLVTPRTIIGRLSRMRRVPFSRGIVLGTGTGAFAWIGEGKPTPVGNVNWTPASLPPSKAGGIVVMTEDLLRTPTLSAEGAIRDELVDGITHFLDSAFIDPTVAPVAGESPGSITNDITAIPSSGDPIEDLHALLAEFVTLDGVVVVASEHALIAIATAAPGAVQGGQLFGVVPFVASSAAGNNLVAVHAPSIMYGDEGGIEINSARHATLQMSTTPDEPWSETTVMTSLWQNNMAAVRVVRWISWQRRNTAAVARVSGASYAVGG